MNLNHPRLSDRIFFPRPDPPPAPVFAVPCPAGTLHCWRGERDPAAPTLLHFHGNGEVVADYVASLAEWFLGLGVNVCFAEYRGYGGSGGAPALQKMLEDGDHVLKALGLPEERVVAFGRSLGSLYAAEFVHRHPRAAGLVLESSVADPRAWLRNRMDPAELGYTETDLAAVVMKHFNHATKLGGYRGPVLILHAEHDHLLDRSHAEQNFAWSASPDKRLVILPHGDHNTILPANAAEYEAELRGFLGRCRKTS